MYNPFLLSQERLQGLVKSNAIEKDFLPRVAPSRRICSLFSYDIARAILEKGK
jgi:hypothetical protein